MSVVRAAVLGDPIEHSLSPRLHSAGYRAAGMTGWEYGRHRVTENGLEAFLDGREELGLSLTMPLKSALVTIAGERGWAASEDVRVSGVANTLVGLERPRIENTDVDGITYALGRGGLRSLSSGVILGGGATARSALVALRRLGATRVVAFLRTPGKAGQLRALAERLGIDAFDAAPPEGWAVASEDAEATVSTLPGGAADAWAGGLEGARLRPSQVLLDVAYSHGDSGLSSRWRGAGGTAVPGADMLVGQALVQFEIFAEAAGGGLAPELRVAVREAMHTAVGN